MKRRPLSLSERFGSMTQQFGGEKESNLTGNAVKSFKSGPVDKRLSNEGRSRETKENIKEYGYVTRKNLTVQVTKGGSNSEFSSNNNSKYDKQTANNENKEHNRHCSQSMESENSAYSHMNNNSNFGNSSANECNPAKNETVIQSSNVDSSPKFVSGVNNKEFHSVPKPYHRQHYNSQNEFKNMSLFSGGKWSHTANNGNYGNKDTSFNSYNKNGHQRQSFKGSRGRGDPRQQRNHSRYNKYPRSPEATYTKSLGQTYHKSPGPTYTKSPEPVYHKSPGPTYHKSIETTYSKSPHFENHRVNQFEFAPIPSGLQNDSNIVYNRLENHHSNYLQSMRHDNPHTPPSPNIVLDTIQGNPSIPDQSKIQKSPAFKHSQSIGSEERPLEAYNNPLSPRYINYKGSARIRNSSGESLRQHTSPHYKTSPSFQNSELGGRENPLHCDDPTSFAYQHSQVPPKGMLYEKRNYTPNEGIQSYPPPGQICDDNLNALPTNGGLRQRHFSAGHNTIPLENINTVHPLQKQNSFDLSANRQYLLQDVVLRGKNCPDVNVNTDIHNAWSCLHQNKQELPKPNFRSFDNQPEFNSNLLTPDMTFRDFSSPEAQQPTRAQRHAEQEQAQPNFVCTNSSNNNVGNEQDELVNTLLQQCQAMVKNNHDKQALNKVVSIIQQETSKQKGNMLDCKDTQQINMPSKETKQNVTPASILDKLCSAEARFSPINLSPNDKTGSFLTGMKFEGRTLLKGGVAPRHIPKNYVEKIHKEKPEDPRFSFPNYLKSNKVNIPLPPWAADIYGMETVRQLETMYKLKTEDVPLPVWATDCHSIQVLNDDKQDGHSTLSKQEIGCNNSDTMLLPVDMEIEETSDGLIISEDPPENTCELVDTSVLDVEGRIEALVKSVREESDNKIQQETIRQKLSPKFTFKNSENKPVQVVIGSAKKDQSRPWEKSVSVDKCEKNSRDFDKSLQPYDRKGNEKSVELHDNKRHDVVTYKDRTYEIQHEDSGICRKYEFVSTKTVIIEKGHGRSRSDSRSKSHERIKDSYDSRSDYNRHDRESYRYRRSPSPFRLHYKSRHRHLSESDKSGNSMYHDRCYNDFSPCKKRKLKKELALEYGGDIIYTPDKDGYTSSDTRE